MGNMAYGKRRGIQRFLRAGALGQKLPSTDLEYRIHGDYLLYSVPSPVPHCP